MELKEFWEIIESVRSSAGADGERFLKILHERLWCRSLEDIRAFDAYEAALQRHANTLYGLWCAAGIMAGCGHTSDDGFHYFCAWLVSMGQEVYRRAVDDPDTLAELPDSAENTGNGLFRPVRFELEGLAYIASRVYEERSGGDLWSDSDQRIDADRKFRQVRDKYPAGVGAYYPYTDAQSLQYLPRLADCFLDTAVRSRMGKDNNGSFSRTNEHVFQARRVYRMHPRVTIIDPAADVLEKCDELTRVADSDSSMKCGPDLGAEDCPDLSADPHGEHAASITRPGVVVAHFKRRMCSLADIAESPNRYLYTVIGVAEHTETHEKMVVYRALYDAPFGKGAIYVRPYDMFVSEVDHQKYPDVNQRYRLEIWNGSIWKED